MKRFTNEKLTRIVLRLAVFLLMFWIFMLASCGSKKKLIQKSQFSTEIATVVRVNELTKNDVNTDILTTKVKEENNVSIHENFQGEVADSSKEATVTIEDQEGKKVYRYTNFKNIGSNSSNSITTSKDTFGQNLSKIDKSEYGKSEDSDIKIKSSGSKKEVSKTKPWKFTWWWIAIGVGVYLVVAYFRKTLNPFKWL